MAGAKRYADTDEQGQAAVGRARGVRGQAHLDEDGVVLDVAAILQQALGDKQRAAGCNVHLGHWAAEAAAVRVGLEGIAKVLPGRPLVHQHQGHLNAPPTMDGQTVNQLANTS